MTTQATRAAANDDVTGGRLPNGAEGRGKRSARRYREARIVEFRLIVFCHSEIRERVIQEPRMDI
jgi:hypothetical protein